MSNLIKKIPVEGREKKEEGNMKEREKKEERKRKERRRILRAKTAN